MGPASTNLCGPFNACLIRRRAYPTRSYVISLQNSDPFGGHKSDEPRWEIDFSPDTAEAATWDQVFSIRERYKKDHLNGSYADWLGEFRSWCRSACIEPKTTPHLIDALERHLQFRMDEGISDRGFLKAAVFEMLLENCRRGNQRLIDLLLDVVSNS